MEIGYLLLTGLRAEEPLIPAARLVPELGRAWNAWLEKGLDPARGGPELDASQALLDVLANDPFQVNSVVAHMDVREWTPVLGDLFDALA